MILPGVTRKDRIAFSGRMIKLFLEMGFQEEYAEIANEIGSLVDDLVEQALDETEDSGKCDSEVPGCG